jgi:hypothetical protein
MGVHGVGRGRRSVPLLSLLAHIPRDELDGGLHFGPHARGLLETLHACLAEVFLLGKGADRGDVALDITGNALAIAPHTALHIDAVVGMADGAKAPGDLLALPGEALVLVASHFLMAVPAAVPTDSASVENHCSTLGPQCWRAPVG